MGLIEGGPMDSAHFCLSRIDYFELVASFNRHSSVLALLVYSRCVPKLGQR
ncbi:MAG: hypothetical protein ACI87E_001150 [Mariniblastus sp.]